MAKKLQTAVDAFIAKKAEIDKILARLAAFSDDHFCVDPDEVNWGHVGDLEHYAAKLKEISDQAFHEGEYADLGEDPMGDFHGRNK